MEACCASHAQVRGRQNMGCRDNLMKEGRKEGRKEGMIK
jgi:hypothetical protein